MEILHESSFFRETRAPALPEPEEVRKLNRLSGNDGSTSFDRPPPVIIPSLGLVVKYGGNVTIAEAQTQVMVYERLNGQVPVPEVYGWAKDGDQRFIYMSLVEGDQLNTRWSDLSEGERQAVCQELRKMVEAWKAVEQDGDCRYLGCLGKRPFNEVCLKDYAALVGPFEGVDAVQQFHNVCGIEIHDEIPIHFTHADITPVNILLGPGPQPKVAAILDWGQAGWYPMYWEYCKAHRVTLEPEDFDAASQNAWSERYLPLVVDPVDLEKYYLPWLRFCLSKGF
ncbi:kinase-like domain-containing protein [Truncatella angustata]|uniref:Kinase-like domain-containing protein n=1 Tax=Truncatella angustata TaxID=152316 RepID=A0A9P8RL94_9PEZI|nr:kinase-like domain-containing protein [Truncatella angustata]KAH6645375.1 kinase-like domain-containing protein [Truncatella angustata]KAH8193620.1 hypothetical protein TruAng_012217 [Truncatella angustata]